MIWPRSIADLRRARSLIDAGKAQGLYIGEHPEGAYIPKSLAELAEFQDTVSIRFGRVSQTLFAGLGAFSRLEALWCEEIPPLDMSLFTRLRRFAFFASAKFDVGFAAPRLNTLLVSKSAAQNCRFLEAYKDLEELSLLQASKLKSLDGIELAPKLGKLTLGFVPRLESINALAKCMSLQWFELHATKCIGSYGPAFRTPQLHTLILSKCPGLESIKLVSRLKHLEHLALVDTDVKDGDLHPLMQLVTLRHVGIYPDKKHFSPRAVEVARAVESRARQAAKKKGSA